MSTASSYYKKFNLLLEFQHLTSLNLEGLLFYPSFSNPLNEIDATLLVHSGFWRGAKLSFSICLPTGHVNKEIPFVRLNNHGIFHPLVCPTEGTIATFKSISSSASNLAPLAHALHRIFYTPLPQAIGACDKVLNEEAYKLFQDDKVAFAERVKKSLEQLAPLVAPSPYLIETPVEWTPHLQDTLERILSPQSLDTMTDSFEVDPSSSLAIQASE